jgi:ADP-ribose pyrophosphatase
VNGAGDFHIVGTREVGRAGFLAITEETVEAPDMTRVSRTVVRHPGAVVIVPVVDGTHAILVRQYRAAVDGWLLEVPAGKRDVDGEPPATTAARELLEETGHTAGRIVELAQFFNTPGFCDEYTYLYAALDLDAGGFREPVGAEEQAMVIEHVAFDAVDGLIASGEIRDAKTIIGLLLARAHVAGESGGRT